MQTEREAKNVTDYNVSGQVVVTSANKWPQPCERQKTLLQLPSGKAAWRRCYQIRQPIWREAIKLV